MKTERSRDIAFGKGCTLDIVQSNGQMKEPRSRYERVELRDRTALRRMVKRKNYFAPKSSEEVYNYDKTNGERKELHFAQESSGELYNIF